MCTIYYIFRSKSPDRRQLELAMVEIAVTRKESRAKQTMIRALATVDIGCYDQKRPIRVVHQNQTSYSSHCVPHLYPYQKRFVITDTLVVPFHPSRSELNRATTASSLAHDLEQKRTGGSAGHGAGAPTSGGQSAVVLTSTRAAAAVYVDVRNLTRLNAFWPIRARRRSKILHWSIIFEILYNYGLPNT